MTGSVGLTALQFRCLTFIDETVSETGVAPSYQDIKDYLGLSAKSQVHRLIECLDERGYIIRQPHKARAIQVVRLPHAWNLTLSVMAGMPLPELFKLKTKIEEQIRLKLEAA